MSQNRGQFLQTHAVPGHLVQRPGKFNAPWRRSGDILAQGHQVGLPFVDIHDVGGNMGLA